MNNFGYMFLSYLTDFVKLWLVLWGIMNITPVNKKGTFIKVGIFQGIILVVAGYYYGRYIDRVTIVCTVLVIIVVCCLFEGKLFKKIAYSLLAYVLVLLLDICLVGVFSIFHLESDDRITGMFFSFINIVSLGTFVWFKRSRKKMAAQINISRRIYTLLFSGAGTGILLIAGLLVRSNSKVTETARGVMMIATVVVTISYCAACLMMIFVTESRDNYKALSLISQNIIESQQQYYLLVNEKQQEIRSIRHEMKNHFACIHSLYQSNKLPEMEQYISQLIEASDISADLFDTGNDIVNAILNDAQSRYQKDRIAIRLEGGFPPELAIAPMDLCVIFANIISNAVEAIQAIDQKEVDYYIDVKISSFKDDLYIDVKNPIAENVKLTNGRLMTTKKDKSLHGFGVKNVIQRVEKYQGTYNFKAENSQFVVEIYMKNKE